MSGLREQPLWRAASACWCRFRSTVRQTDYLLPLLRVSFLAVGVWYGWATVSADRMMGRVLGTNEPEAVLKWSAQAIHRYPFDPRLRSIHQMIVGMTANVGKR